MDYNNFIQAQSYQTKEIDIDDILKKRCRASTLIFNNNVLTKKKCHSCYKIKPVDYFRYHNKQKNIRQVYCVACHIKIDNYNKTQNKNGQRIDIWNGRFASTIT